LLLSLPAGAAQGVVDDTLRHRTLPVIHDDVHELGDRLGVVERVGRDGTLDGTVATGHGYPSFFSRLAPYLERPCLRFLAPAVSRVPRMMWYRTPGRSFTRPPRISTTECSWRLCPMPGMYALASIPFVRRTRATLRRAEFGFFGVTVDTRVQTPRRWGAPCRCGVFVFAFFETRPFRINWL